MPAPNQLALVDFPVSVKTISDDEFRLYCAAGCRQTNPPPGPFVPNSSPAAPRIDLTTIELAA